MRRPVWVLGAILLGLGGATYGLLVQLRTETFRADLPPWITGAIALTGVGAVLFVAGLVLPRREMGTLNVASASKYMGYATLVNTVAGACFSVPVLVPAFEFPILITRWPGVYMVIAYSFFVMIGVLGSFAWSAFYRSLPELFSREAVYRALFIFQFSAMEGGVYLMSVFMFLGGYVGSALVHQGIGDAVVGAAMEFSVIPSALGIFLVAASAVVGVANALLSKKLV